VISYQKDLCCTEVGRLEYPEAWAKIRVTGTILVLATKEGGKAWIPGAVVPHAIRLSQMLK